MGGVVLVCCRVCPVLFCVFCARRPKAQLFSMDSCLLRVRVYRSFVVHYCFGFAFAPSLLMIVILGFGSNSSSDFVRRTCGLCCNCYKGLQGWVNQGTCSLLLVVP